MAVWVDRFCQIKVREKRDKRDKSSVKVISILRLPMPELPGQDHFPQRLKPHQFSLFWYGLKPVPFEKHGQMKERQMRYKRGKSGFPKVDCSRDSDLLSI